MSSLQRAKHELLESVEQMLTPQTLSDLVQSPINHVQRTCLDGRNGTSNNTFEWVNSISKGGDETRYALKRIQFNDDWFMNTTNDVLCRSVTLWQYGLLDQLASHVDHTIIACSRDGEGWAILMKDVSAGQHPALDRLPKLHQIYGFLDALAFIHATFWENDNLKSEHLGLNDNASLIGMTSVASARKFAHIPGVISGWILKGWEAIETLLEADTSEIFRALMLNPKPLYDAIARYPTTLAHGDYRAGTNANVSYMPDQTVPICAFDWQHAGYALMTIDMAWFANRFSITPVISPHDAAAYYRERLERYLGFYFDPTQWQAMFELALLADTLRMGCIDAYFAIHSEDEANCREARTAIDAFNEQIRAGARWL